MINLEYGHRCRADPVEAAVYSLEAKGEDLKWFRSIATTEVTVDLEQNEDQRQEHSFQEFPVDFSREDVAKVLEFTCGPTHLK